MSINCALTTGYEYECDDSTGGIKAGSFLVTQWEHVKDGFTIATNNEVTAISQNSGTAFYRYEMKKEIVDFVSTENHDPMTGSLFYESVINAMLNNMTSNKSTELRVLAMKPLVIIIQDLNDVYHIFGVESGAEKVGGTNQAASGKEYGTHNGYTMGFTDKSKKLYTVDSSTVGSLIIDGETS